MLFTAENIESVELSAEEVEGRAIRRAELVPDRSAFIDTILPECAGKENYALIGPGVSENPNQIVPVTDPHGFNLGVAALPHGVTNSLHLHFTAEVFSCISGEWLFRWGVDGTDGEAIVRPGDIISVPSWLFRGFTNLGDDDAWMFSSLGQDETGGILWAPSVLEAAGKMGSFLSADNKMVKGAPGVPPEGVELTKPLPDDELAKLPRLSVEEMGKRLTTQDDLVWSSSSFLDSKLDGGKAEFSPVIGYGITEDRKQSPHVHNPHGFTMGWLRAAQGEGMLTHRHADSQVLMVKDGQWRITLNQENPVTTEIGPLDSFSVPAGTWRRIESVGEEPGLMVVMTGGDGRTRLEWDEDVQKAALAKGVAYDTDGYLAPAAVVA